MTQVIPTPEGFEVEAGLLASAFGIDERRVRDEMRAGAITSLCETGVDADAGRSRVTFRYGNRVLRLIVDDAGKVISNGRFDVRPRP